MSRRSAGAVRRGDMLMHEGREAMVLAAARAGRDHQLIVLRSLGLPSVSMRLPFDHLMEVAVGWEDENDVSMLEGSSHV